ncbi:hypothetical protein [Allobranchiibius sp. GilTou73]|uniref:hypothetical protein n=1 Tax=Allobranchiibius sp. GilTou73 TaxID=2904523 RepID=UPI001F40AAEE|nr:hypothetical protein [Allobranchiibius sp. GilTou73]UIJ34497.1 hypothetical protein LVQ62_15510 [Allobranchiibius sp. GilTou73]
MSDDTTPAGLDAGTTVAPATPTQSENDSHLTGTASDTSGSTEPEVDGGDKGNREAAKYRTRLRETEAQRDTLAAQVESYQRGEVHRLAGAQLAVGADVFDIGKVELSDLLDANGNVVPELVETAVMGLVESRPGLAKTKQRQGPSPVGVGKYPIPPQSGGWSGLLNGR